MSDVLSNTDLQGLLLSVTVFLVAGNPAKPRRPRGECPSSYGDILPVLIISMDGFRADYLDRAITPTINALAKSGVTAPFIKPSYPSVTFPNHYSIATGSYPEYHGIIDNIFYDPVFNATFELGTEESMKGRWWGAEPIWNTVNNQGKKSASFSWPGAGADIGGQRPTYWFPYDDEAPFEDRVDQVLEWIMLPVESRPSWISLYFYEPDLNAHDWN